MNLDRITPEGQPNCAEHAEARQADCNARKEARRAELPAAEQAQLATIEEAVRTLEQAKIPFLLYADSMPFEGSTGASHLWQYNKLGYEPDWDTMAANGQKRGMALIDIQMKTMSKCVHGTFVWYGSDDKPAVVARAGQTRWREEMKARETGSDGPSAP